MNTSDLAIFINAAQMGNLSAAARLLELSPAVASAAIKRLEAELKAPLFIRSTRQLRLTSEGEAYLQHCEQALELLNQGQAIIQHGQAHVDGELRLSAPSDFGRQYVVPWLDEFMAQHPRLNIRLKLSDKISDFYHESVDVALRYGQLRDSPLIALPLCPSNRRVLCASPQYTKQNGVPLTPEDLVTYNCLRLIRADEVYEHWRYISDGDQKTVQVSGNRLSDDGGAVRQWTIQGCGIAYKSYLDILADVLANRLVVLNDHVMSEPLPLYFVYADRRHRSAAIQQLKEFLQKKCAKLAHQDKQGIL